MDDFSIFGDSFKDCLSNLKKVLIRCEEQNLVLNWKKYHSRPLCNILLKDNVFEWTEECENAFFKLKSMFTTTPIMQPPD